MKPLMPPFDKLFETFLDVAHELGNYCAEKNELSVRKRGKDYRFICSEDGLRCIAPGQPEVVIPIAYDATVSELKRGIRWLTGNQLERW